MSKCPEWLDRSVAVRGPHLMLCTSESQFKSALAFLKVSSSTPWLARSSASATMHTFDSDTDAPTCIVCLSGDRHGRSGAEIAGLLVHEAVHIWQEYCAHYGEEFPGREQEAYAIQSISETLMTAYANTL